MRRYGFLAGAIALPALLAIASLQRGHHGDMAVFREWYLQVRAHPSRMYVTPRRDVNYPILGAAQAVAPGVVLHALGGRPAEPHRYRAGLKALLVPWNVAMIALFAALAASLGMARRTARARALGFFALPCTWVGGLYFGQIDGMTTALQLAAALCGTQFVLRSRPDAPVPWRWFTAALVLLHASVLTKQLALFALPGLLALLVAGLVRSTPRGDPRRVVAGVLVALGSTLLLRLPDPFLVLPPGYRSHVALIALGVGPRHGDYVGNGPGIFAFLTWAPDASAHTPLVAGVSPRALGLWLFALAQLALAALTARRAWPYLRRVDRDAARETAYLCLNHAGASNLAMGALLCGTHERYLYAAWPFLLLATSYRAAVDRTRGARALAIACWLTGAVYGLFVLSTIEWDAFAAVPLLRSTRLVAVLVLALLAALVAQLLRAPVAPARAASHDAT